MSNETAMTEKDYQEYDLAQQGLRAIGELQRQIVSGEVDAQEADRKLKDIEKQFLPRPRPWWKFW